MDTFGARLGLLIRTKRGIEGLTQQQLALVAFGDESFKTRISELENGKVANPQQKTVDSLVVALEISSEELAACRVLSQDADAAIEHETLASNEDPRRAVSTQNRAAGSVDQGHHEPSTAPSDADPAAGRIQRDENISRAAPRRFRWLKLGALGFLLLGLGVASVGMMTRNPDSPYWPDSGPTVFMITESIMTETDKSFDVITQAVVDELGQGYATTSLERWEESDIGFYLMLDWATLNEMEGMQEVCGDECTPTGTMSFSRVYEYFDHSFSRKDIFVDLSRFVEVDPTRGILFFKEDGLGCLAEVIAREIKVKNSADLEVLDCHKEFLKGQTSTVSQHRVNRKSFWFEVRGLFQ